MSLFAGGGNSSTKEKTNKSEVRFKGNVSGEIVYIKDKEEFNKNKDNLANKILLTTIKPKRPIIFAAFNGEENGGCVRKYI